MSGNGLVDGDAVLQAADVAGAYDGAFAGHVAPGFKPDEAAGQVVAFAVGHFHPARNAQLHRHRGLVTGYGGVGVSPLNQHRFGEAARRDVRQGRTFTLVAVGKRLPAQLVGYGDGLVLHLRRRRDAVTRIERGRRRDGPRLRRETGRLRLTFRPRRRHWRLRGRLTRCGDGFRPQRADLSGKRRIILTEFVNLVLIACLPLAEQLKLAAHFGILLLHLGGRSLHLGRGMLLHLLVKGAVHHAGHIGRRLAGGCRIAAALVACIRQIPAAAAHHAHGRQHDTQPDKLLALHH